MSGYTSNKAKVTSITIHYSLIIQLFNPTEPEFLEVLLIKYIQKHLESAVLHFTALLVDRRMKITFFFLFKNQDIF
jgi:hypothetical protein